MDKKTILLELPCELIDKIDKLNNIGDRSDFIANLLEKQIFQDNAFFTRKDENERLSIAGEIDILNNEGLSIGRFNLNTLEGFEDLAKTIQEVSSDPVVKIRARQWL